MRPASTAAASVEIFSNDTRMAGAPAVSRETAGAPGIAIAA